MSLNSAVRSARRRLRALRRHERGVALIEFAFATPVVLSLMLYGFEVANLALVHLKVSQISSNLADTASRIGANSTLSEKQIRESDINDAFAAVREQSGRLDVTTNGRVMLSSLEQNATNGQWVHWQRCVGMRRSTSSYGVPGDGITGTAFPGMGPVGQEVRAPVDTAVMFVEIVYAYQPVVHARITGPQIVRARSAFIVRERRDLDNADNPSNPVATTVASTCDRFTI